METKKEIKLIVAMILSFFFFMSCSMVNCDKGSCADEDDEDNTALNFVPDPGIRIKNAMEPSPLIANDGNLYLFYTDKSSSTGPPYEKKVAVSEDGLNFTQTGLDPDEVNVGNPHAKKLPDGTYRVYIFDAQTGELWSKYSEDGITYTEDHTVRYSVPEEQTPIGVYDLFVNKAEEVVLLYIAPMRQDADQHIRMALSTDGGYTFEYYNEDPLGDSGKSIKEINMDPKFLILPNGKARLFTMVQNQIVQPGVRSCCEVYSFTTENGYTYTKDEGTRLSTDDFEDIEVWTLNDPFVIQLSDGRYRMYVGATITDNDTGEFISAVLSATAD